MGTEAGVRADRWIAPWTAEQVAALNAMQTDGKFHGYTCPGRLDCCQDHQKLFATSHGWVCRCGAYRQAWAHAMAAPPGVDGETKEG